MPYAMMLAQFSNINFVHKLFDGSTIVTVDQNTSVGF